ncbi:hypothetical protein [Legionella busanensis]|nr:hypothetical protein [Legionella busanensis]
MYTIDQIMRMNYVIDCALADYKRIDNVDEYAFQEFKNFIKQFPPHEIIQFNNYQKLSVEFFRDLHKRFLLSKTPKTVPASGNRPIPQPVVPERTEQLKEERFYSVVNLLAEGARLEFTAHSLADSINSFLVIYKRMLNTKHSSFKEFTTFLNKFAPQEILFLLNMNEVELHTLNRKFVMPAFATPEVIRASQFLSTFNLLILNDEIKRDIISLLEVNRADLMPVLRNAVVDLIKIITLLNKSNPNKLLSSDMIFREPLVMAHLQVVKSQLQQLSPLLNDINDFAHELFQTVKPPVSAVITTIVNNPHSHEIGNHIGTSDDPNLLTEEELRQSAMVYYTQLTDLIEPDLGAVQPDELNSLNNSLDTNQPEVIDLSSVDEAVPKPVKNSFVRKRGYEEKQDEKRRKTLESTSQNFLQHNRANSKTASQPTFSNGAGFFGASVSNVQQAEKLSVTDESTTARGPLAFGKPCYDLNAFLENINDERTSGQLTFGKPHGDLEPLFEDATSKSARKRKPEAISYFAKRIEEDKDTADNSSEDIGYR